MNNLTIKQFCQLESLKSDLNLQPNHKYQEQFQESFTVIKIADFAGNTVQELIFIL